MKKYRNQTNGEVVDVIEWGTPLAATELRNFLGTEPFVDEETGKPELSHRSKGTHYLEDGDFIVLTHGESIAYTPAEFSKIYRE